MVRMIEEVNSSYNETRQPHVNIVHIAQIASSMQNPRVFFIRRVMHNLSLVCRFVTGV